MISSFLLALREGIEAALVVGLLLSVLRRIRRQDGVAAVWFGVIAGVVASAGAALLLRAIGWNLEGRAEAIFEGATSWIAAGLLTGVIFWLRKQSGGMQAALKTEIQNAAGFGGGAVFVVAFVAVAREGVELAIFLTAASLGSDAVPTLVGACLGLGVAALAGCLLFATSLRFDLRRFFQISNALLLLLAAGLVAKGVGEFSEAGWLAPIIDPLWNTSAWLPETSGWGAMLKSLFGYNSTPSFAQAFAYAAFLLCVGLSLVRDRPNRA
jgi:high-affinity iron transporter